jgi:hypothetical protein
MAEGRGFWIVGHVTSDKLAKFGPDRPDRTAAIPDLTVSISFKMFIYIPLVSEK